jgi:hypothetical protein
VYGCAPARIAFAVSDDGPTGLRKAHFTFLENPASGLDLNQTHFTHVLQVVQTDEPRIGKINKNRP